MEGIMGIDPGREKCGIAVIGLKGEILLHQVIETEVLAEAVKSIMRQYTLQKIVMGNGTSSKQARKIVKEIYPDLAVIEEYRTTDMARLRYWQENPPASWRKLMPAGLLVPPVPVDDYAAVIIAEKWTRIENK